jgi:hypothetical protein
MTSKKLTEYQLNIKSVRDFLGSFWGKTHPYFVRAVMGLNP